MGNCCIHTEANHRNSSPAPFPIHVQSDRPVPGPFPTPKHPTPPPYSLHRHETKDVTPTIPHFAPSNKRLTFSHFSCISKNKALTASTMDISFSSVQGRSRSRRYMFTSLRLR